MTRVWCHGSQAFLDHVARFVEVSPISSESMREMSRGSHAIVELESGKEGKESFEWVKRIVAGGVRVAVACRNEQIKAAVQAVAAGAQCILLKPLSREALATYQIPVIAIEDEDEGDAPADLVAWRKNYASEIIGESENLLEALELAMQASAFDCPVLITGESGTGKELLAQAVHRASARRDKPFVPVNSPAIPKDLVESELFGHAKGAFTGATNARIGRFAAADGGSIFLDEIGEMNPTLQCKLLRVLQDYCVTPVGESRSQRVDVRVIAATNRNLEQLITDGGFRDDLYYRLNVVHIHLPALRERPDDVPLLIDSLLKSLSETRRVKPPVLTAEVREALLRYTWPGNVRQLHNTIERLVIMRHGRTTSLSHLPPRVVQGEKELQEAALAGFDLPKEGLDLKEFLQQLEDQLIRKALLSTNGNRNQAARILGMNRTTLVEKLRKRPCDGASDGDDLAAVA